MPFVFLLVEYDDKGEQVDKVDEKTFTNSETNEQLSISAYSEEFEEKMVGIEIQRSAKKNTQPTSSRM